MPKAPINNERITSRQGAALSGDEVCVIIKLPLGAFEAKHEAHEKQILAKQCEAHVKGACTTSGCAIISYQP